MERSMRRYETINETGLIRMKYSMGEAAKATGKSKATIHRAIKSGKISAHKKEDGSYEIDPSELHRVFEAVSQNSYVEPSMRQSETHDEMGVLQRELMLLREERERERSLFQETVNDLRQRLDSESEERRKLVNLLTYQQEKTPTSEISKKEGFFQRIFGFKK
jgi:hypothetical protein